MNLRALLPGLIGVAKAAAAVLLAAAATAEAREVATDRLIVRLEGGAPALQKSAREREAIAAHLTARSGEMMLPLRVMGDGAQVMQLFRRLSATEVQSLSARVAGTPGVIEVLPDRIFFPALTPNDSLFAQQWYLTAASGINAPAAWDITTGANNLIIGIVDTGKLPHDELASRWIGGYDFVSLTERANDGNLRDADASDPGDWVTAAEAASGPLAGCPTTDSRWHGTLMAGVIGATANNSAGIAGVNWSSKLLPVRVVGKCGGYESDIADGMRWAVGIPVSGVPANPDTADLLNVSLAAPGACSSALQSAVNEVVAAGVPIIVAAGNFSLAATGYSPGNCTGVIAVGAVDRNGGKASYTNFGPPIALSAPGGKAVQDFSGGDTQANQWLVTTSNAGLTTPDANDSFYANVFGTSIAAAQVTGIASLMLSIKPTLAPDEVRNILRSSARTFPTNTTALGSQADCTTALCGSGIAAARGALDLVQLFGSYYREVAGGNLHGVGLRSDGRVYTWGYNQVGQLGDGTAAPLRTSASLLPGISGVVDIAAGYHHTLALRSDGTVWGWGLDSSGELGDNDPTPSGTGRNVPVTAQLAGTYTQVAAGFGHGLALRSDGSVWGWGRNAQGEVGNGSQALTLAPAMVVSLGNVVAISAAGESSAALRSDNTAWVWGFHPCGSLGATGTPHQVPISGVSAIASGAEHVLVLKNDGTLWACGRNQWGQLGWGEFGNNNNFEPVPVMSNVVGIAAGWYYSLAVKADGTVWAWGRNDAGQLGDGTTISRPAPVQVAGVSGVSGLAGSPDNTFAWKPDGSVFGWGGNNVGSLGVGNEVSQRLPVQLVGAGMIGFLDLGVADPTMFAPHTDVPLSSVRTSNTIAINAIAMGTTLSMAGGEYSIGCTGSFTAASSPVSGDITVCVRQTAAAAAATTTTATLTLSGATSLTRAFSVTTQAGDATPDDFRFAPQASVPVTPGITPTSNTVTISGINVPVAISITGGEYSIGCTASFTAAPGTITNGQTVCVRQEIPVAAPFDTLTTALLTVGTLTRPFHVTTVVSAAFNTAREVAGGNLHGVGLRSDGRVYTWGFNHVGQLGDGTTVPQRTSAMLLPGISGVVDIAAGYHHTLALRSDGTVWGWGLDSSGELGDNDPTPSNTGRNVPVTAQLAGTYTQVAAGFGHGLALRSDGSVWGWGRNAQGEVGNGSQALTLAPAMVVSLGNVVAISAAGESSAALRSDNTAWVWGFQPCGSLGATGTPHQVPISGVSAIASGAEHVLVLKNDGTLWACGRNQWGQLGWGEFGNNNNFEPVPVMSNVVGIAAGWYYSLAVKADGTVWAWGRNDAGQLGDGTTISRPAPVQVAGVSGVSGLAGSPDNTFAWKPDGSVFGWGGNNVGSLGVGNEVSQRLPVQLVGAGMIGFLDLGVADPTMFAPHTDVPLSSVRTSNTIAINAIAMGTTLSMAGGEYSIGCTGSFTAASSPVSGDITVCVRQTAAAAAATTTTATLTLSGATSLTRAFSVTTQAGDATPDDFRFAPQASVPVTPGITPTSNTVTISGINVPVAISITGGEYSIGCTASFTAAPGTITNGQTVCVRQEIPVAAPFDTLTTALLTVGTLTRPFHVTTVVSAAFNTAREVAGGNLHGVGLRSDGRVYTWGYNQVGQLGDGTAAPLRTSASLLPGISGVVDIAAGYHHTLALRSDGTVWGWGLDSSGELGDNDPTPSGTGRNVPVTAQLAGTYTQVAAGFGHGLALRSDGSVWGWGRNAQGEVGNGSQALTLAPAMVLPLSNVVAISAAGESSAALRSDNTAWVWGFQPCGALGATGTPHQVPISGVSAIASGAEHVLVLKNDGTLWACGRNQWGQLGWGEFDNNNNLQPVPVMSNVVGIAAGWYYSLAVKADGTVWTWGRNDTGQLGDGTTISRAAPVQVAGVSGVSGLAGSPENTFAWKPDGSVFGWGGNNLGSLGVGNEVPQRLPVQLVGVAGDDFLSLLVSETTPAPFYFTPQFGVAPGTLVESNPVVITGIAAPAAVAVTGGEYSIGCTGSFIASAGTITNGQSICVRVLAPSTPLSIASVTLAIGGQFGRSSTFFVRTRADPGAIRVVPMVAAGDSHTYLLGPDALVYATGYNGNGQLGNGTTLGLSTLRAVAGLADARSIASGAFHGLALRGDGTVAAWGSNSAGQLGHNSANNSERYFVDVSGLPDVASIAAGKYHSVALKGGGTVWAWGLNAEGQVGDGSSVGTRLAPVQVTGLVGVTAIAAGGRHNLALLVDGTVQSWGANESGQLGDGSSTQRNSPVPVSGLSNVVAIAAGDAHSLALKSDGTVVAWGFNAFGQLGDGSTTTRLAPVPVASLGNNVGLIAAGANHSLAVKVGGGLYTWGNNANSQLANGGNTNGLTPTLIAVPSNVVAIAGGARHSAAIDANRRLYLWGDNFFGQVGNRSGNYSPQSAALNVLRGDAVVSTGGGFGGGGASTGGNSGSSVLEVDNQQTGFDFGSRSSGLPSMIQGRFKNQAALEDITGVSVAVNGASFGLVTNTCPATLTPDQECSFTIGFTPSAATNYSGELIVNSSVVGSPERRALFGSGIPPAAAAIAFAKAGLDFAPQLVGQASMATFALNNVGNAALTVTGITSSTTDFTSTHTCTNVPSGAGCQFDVTFVPVAAGARTAILTVTSNASGSPHTVTLSGTGAPTTAAPLDPFADQDADGIPNGVEVAEGRNPNLKDNDIFAIARLFAMQQYRDFLGREGEATGIDFFVDLLNTGAAVRGNVVESFFNSPEFQGSVAPIVRLYFATFLRIPDYPGLIFQTNAFRSGTPLEVIANNFTLSPEFQATYGALDNAQYVALLYQNILSRTPSQGEIDFHVARLVSGVTRGAVLVGFSESPEYQQASAIDVYVTMMYVGMLRRAPEQAGFDFWTDYMEAGNPGLALILGFLQAPEYRNRFLPP